MTRSRSAIALITSATLILACGDGGAENGPSRITSPAAHASREGGLGSKLVFVSTRDNPGVIPLVSFELYASNSDGTNPVRLSNNSFGEFFPTWSPNGREIVFDSNEGFAPANVKRLYIMNGDGSGRRLLTSGTAATWLHNGQKLAFHDADATSAVAGDTNVFVINADGTGRTRLTDYPGMDADADWSPDGRTIVFTSKRSTGTINLHLMDADGSNVRHFLNNPVGEDAAPDWSPDGKSIVFARRRVPAHMTYEIYTVKVDGSELTRLTFNETLDATPSWSPDGKQISYHSGGGNPQMHVMNADGSGKRAVTSPPGRSEWGNWGNGHLR
ncbi:MAG: hypothetical protein ACSLFE_11890 [Gemmatimonadaceae bacterium]